MDFITAVTRLLRQYSPQPETSFLPEGKLKKLFHLAASGKATTDREAVQHLYGPGAKPQDKKFLMLKKELETRLIDHLLQQHSQDNTLSNSKGTSNQVRVTKLWCRKQMILTELLLDHNLHQYAEKILLKVSKQAEKLLFYHILEETWMLLRQVYMLKGDAKKIAIYDEKIKQLEKQNQRINQATGWYELLQVQANSTIARSESLAQQAHQQANTVAQWLSETNDPFLERYYHRICTIEYTNHPDTGRRDAGRRDAGQRPGEALQSLIQEKAAFVKRHRRFRNRHQLIEVTLNRIYLCQARGNLKSAKRYAERALAFENLPWNLLLSVQEKAFIIYIRLQDYDSAGEILRQVTRTKQAQLLSPFQASQWYLREAYLYYGLVHQSNLEKVDALTPRFARKISLSEFDHHTAPLASDKKGYQVQVLIMKTLLLHQTRKGTMEYQAKSLNMYYRRHLTDLHDIKTKLFFQIITKAASVNFDKKKTVQRAGSLVQALEAMPDHFQEHQELIPYKVLWEIIKSGSN